MRQYVDPDSGQYADAESGTTVLGRLADLLNEVDRSTGCFAHLTHLSSGEPLDGERTQQLIAAVMAFLVLIQTAILSVYGAYRIESSRLEAAQARRLGQYLLREKIGSGGMGEVYRADHLLLRRPCAIKLIRPEVAGDPKNLIEFDETKLNIASKFRTPPGDIPNVTQAMVDDPNSVLVKAIAGQNIISTTGLRVSTTPLNPPTTGGGTVSANAA